MQYHLKSVRHDDSRRHFLPAFSLIEVLVVIGIISILMSAAALGLKNLAAGKGTVTASATCESLLSEARSIAVSKRCKARLMIDVDDPTSNNYLRRVVVAHERIDPATGDAVANDWVVTNRGYMMPGGTFYSREYSKLSNGTKIVPKAITGTTLKTSFQGNYACYEFNAEGISSNPGASFIVGSGVRPKGKVQPFTKSKERDFAGFVVWRNGRTSTYRSLQQMNLTSSKEF